MSGNEVSRRRALALLGLGAATTAAGVTGWVAQLGVPGGGTGGTDEAAGGRPLTEPAALASQDGVLEASLTAAAGVTLAGRPGAGLGFNGASPGPTLRVRPGEVLRIRLVNHLEHPTNLHTHGLHVSPDGRGDNPFLSIEPGTAFDYVFRLPRDHPPGTFWYHPHRHGFVADQVFGGLFGALIVEGGPDLGVTADRILLVSDVSLDNTGRVAPVSAMDRMMGRQGSLLLVNGRYQPVVTAKTGTAERWRLINACTSRVLSLHLEGHPWTQLTNDGYFLPAPAERDRVVLAPGNRADVLVHPAGTGRYRLVTEDVGRGMPGMMGGMGGGRRPDSAGDPITLGTMAVSGQGGGAPAVPRSLPVPPLPSGPVTARRKITLDMRMGMGRAPMSFAIDGREFDPERTDQAARLGTTEDWVVSNTGPLDHPFHLHVWPFQVLATSAGPAAEQTLRDVVLVPARGWVRLRVRFADHPGRSVYHCHILDHEDLGMMATVQVSR